MKVCVFCGSHSGNNPKFGEAAFSLGEWIAENGHSLVYGGSDRGLMGDVSRGCHSKGGEVIGIEPRFFLEQGFTSPSVTTLIPTEDMGERKKKMVELSDAYIALPGGIGTLDEISEVSALLGLERTKGSLVLYNIDHFYEPLMALLHQYDEAGFLPKGWKGWPVLASSLEEIVDILKKQEEK